MKLLMLQDVELEKYKNGWRPAPSETATAANIDCLGLSSSDPLSSTSSTLNLPCCVEGLTSPAVPVHVSPEGGLHRYAYGDSDTGISRIEQVIAVVRVDNVNIVRFIPVV